MTASHQEKPDRVFPSHGTMCLPVDNQICTIPSLDVFSHNDDESTFIIGKNRGFIFCPDIYAQSPSDHGPRTYPIRARGFDRCFKVGVN